MQTLLKAFQHLALPRGRIARRWYWTAMAGLIALILLLLPLIDEFAGRWAILLLYTPIYWAMFCLMSQRCHDAGLSSTWLLILPIPIAGVIWWIAVLGFKRGDRGDNQYGANPRPPEPDYLTVRAIT